MLRKIPKWKLVWAPRAMRCWLATPAGYPMIDLAPAGAEGRSHFGDHVALLEAAPAMLEALQQVDKALSASAWLGDPDTGSDAAQALEEVRQAIKLATGA